MVRPGAAGPCRQAVPALRCQPAVFGEPLVAQHVGIKGRGPIKCVIAVLHLAIEKIACEPHRIGPRDTGGGKMDIAGALKQRAAMAVGVVDFFDRLPDAKNGVFGKPQRHCRARGRLVGKTVEHRFHTAGPGEGCPVVDKPYRAGRAVERLAKAAFDRLIAFRGARRGHVEPAKQRHVACRQVDDHRDQGIDAACPQMVPDPRERIGFSVGAILAGLVGRQCRGHHVLAKAEVHEGRTGALAIDFRAESGQDGTIIVRPGDLRQHTGRAEVEDFHLAAQLIGLAARKDLFAGNGTQCIDVKAGSHLGHHEIG